MSQVPFPRAEIDKIIEEMCLDISTASIRELNSLVDRIEKKLNNRFIRLEFGIPGLEVSEIAIEAEREALESKGLANRYAPISGVRELREAGSAFVKAFLNINVPPSSVVVTHGAMHASFVAQAISGFHDLSKDTILFLDPGFPPNKLQARLLGLNSAQLELKDFRGEKLVEKVEELCVTLSVGGVIWSSPNNPSWVVLTKDELEGLAEVFDRYSVFAIEDMAYFGMDFREDYSVPYEEPFPPTISRHTDRVFLIISSSKLFSYAGQRCALCIIPPRFAKECYPDLKLRFSKDEVLEAFVHGGIYPITASIAQGPQAGLAALLRAACESRYNPWLGVREYGRRAAHMKKSFTDNGFCLVYDEDLGRPLADGFYFTIAYPPLTGGELARELVYYGISAITLETTGSKYTEGLRVCVSRTDEEQFSDLDDRLVQFHKDHRLS